MSETTQRAYSMRLKADAENRDALIALHLAGNHAIEVWANHLLTLRGGVEAIHAIHDDPAIARWRRIVLCLSWFSVESKDKAPERYQLAAKDLPRRFVEALLAERVANAEAWLEDCQHALHAAIRDDAVWVDRRAMFQDAGLHPEMVWDLFSDLFGGIDGFFAQATGDAGGMEAVKVASQWLSSRFGVGKGSDFEALAGAYFTISGMEACPTPGAARELAAALSQPGPPNKVQKALALVAEGEFFEAEAWTAVRDAAAQQAKKKSGSVGRKGPRPWSDRMMESVMAACGIPYALEKGTNHGFHTTMLDLACRRVVVHHRLQLNQEKERLALIDALPGDIPQVAFDHLTALVEQRQVELQAFRPYAIRLRALGGWSDIVKRWEGNTTEKEREAAIAQVQAAFGKKFGDATLFSLLARDEAVPVWRTTGSSPEILTKFAKYSEGLEKLRDLKIVTYRHNDALRHPVFIEFGAGRLKIKVSGKLISLNGISDGNGVCLAQAIWQSNRIANRKRPGDRGDDRERNVILASLEDNTNGKLMFDRVMFMRIDAVERNLDMAEADRQTRVSQLWRQTPIWLSFSARISTVGAWAEFAQANGLPTGLTDRLFQKENKTRKGRARLTYSRLPGLRVLGVDLRMRHGAAVALWEALSDENLKALCVQAGVTPPTEDVLSLCLSIVEQGKRRRLILRRTGPDVFPDGEKNPTAWAVLVGKKRIEVQGEGDRIRKASPEELSFAESFFCEYGLNPPTVTGIDDLQESVLRRARLELRRHSDYAELAASFGTTEKANGSGPLTNDELVRRTLYDLKKWHRRAFGRFDDDRFARTLWEDFVGTDRELPKVDDAKRILVQRGEISTRFAAKWREEEASWPKWLERIQNWILPRQGQQAKGTNWHTGGLSLRRIRRIDDLAGLVSSFRGRPTPTNQKGGRRPMAQFKGERTNIKAIAARLKEERSRQTAAAVVKIAKGLDERLGKAHAIVIEDMSYYRPNRSTQTREENRRLAEWCASRIGTHIKQGAERNGIRVIEISPQYTSIQFAATGGPGMACRTIPANELITSTYWQQELARAQKRGESAMPREKYLLEILAAIRKVPESALGSTTVTFPSPGGKEIYSTTGLSLACDLNAAANIGLRPLLDPDGCMAWWNVPVEVHAGKLRPSAKDTEGSSAFGEFRPKAETTKENGIVNVWRDLQGSMGGDGWMTYADYLKSVEDRLIEYLKNLQT